MKKPRKHQRRVTAADLWRIVRWKEPDEIYDRRMHPRQRGPANPTAAAIKSTLIQLAERTHWPSEMIEVARDGECGHEWQLLGVWAVCVREAGHEGMHCGWRPWAQRNGDE